MRTDTRGVALMVGALIVGLAIFVAGFVIAMEIRSAVASPPEEQKTYGPGWLNMAHVGATQAIGEALSGIEANVGVVYYLSPDTGAWLRYVPSKPEVSNLTTMEFGQPYLVLLTAPTVMTIPTEETFLATPTPCPDYPCGYGSGEDACAAFAIKIDSLKVRLDIEEEVGLAGTTPDEIRAEIAQGEQLLDELCQGVQIAAPSSLTSLCSSTGEWRGMFERENFYDPDPQYQVWIDQFDNIIDDYCRPDY